MQTIVRKTETIRKGLGSLSTVIDRDLERLLKGGIRRSEIERTAREIGGADLEAEKRRAIDDELETARQNNLRESIDSLRILMDGSKKEVGLDEGHFRSAVSCALEIMGSKPRRDLGGGRMDAARQLESKTMQIVQFDPARSFPGPRSFSCWAGWRSTAGWQPPTNDSSRERW